MEYKNGSLWKNGKTTAILQKLTDDLFCLLSVDDSGGFSVVADPSNKWQYAAEELPALLEGWESAVGHVSIAQPDQTPHVASEKIETPKKATSTRKARR